MQLICSLVQFFWIHKLINWLIIKLHNKLAYQNKIHKVNFIKDLKIPNLANVPKNHNLKEIYS